MKRRIAFHLPIIGRCYEGMAPLIYRKGEIVGRVGFEAPRRGNIQIIKKAARQFVRDWLKKNGIARSSVVIECRDIEQDYGERVFVVLSKCKAPFTIHVPPLGDDFWKSLT